MAPPSQSSAVRQQHCCFRPPCLASHGSPSAPAAPVYCSGAALPCPALSCPALPCPALPCPALQYTCPPLIPILQHRAAQRSKTSAAHIPKLLVTNPLVCQNLSRQCDVPRELLADLCTALGRDDVVKARVRTIAFGQSCWIGEPVVIILQ